MNRELTFLDILLCTGFSNEPPRQYRRFRRGYHPANNIAAEDVHDHIQVDVIRGLHPDVSEFLSKNKACGEDQQKTAYQIFKLLKQFSKGMIVSIVSECLLRKSPRLKTLLSYLHIQQTEEDDAVCPQNPDLLNITYKARALEEYEDEDR